MKKSEAITYYGDRISEVIDAWLKEEVESSGLDKNQFLDEYETAVRGMRNGWEDPENFAARKLESHLDRLPLWFEAYAFDPEDDYQAARIVFAGLMQVSGTYRDQCYVQAENKEEYLKLRKAGIGIDQNFAIKNRLQYLLPSPRQMERNQLSKFSQANVDIESLSQAMTSVSSIGERAIRTVVRRVQAGKDLGQKSSASVSQLKYAQLEWLGLSTQLIVHSIKVRDGMLSRVPILQPKSISADPPPEIIYPFGSAI